MKRLAIFVTALFLCACGGGGGGATHVPSVVPTGAAPGGPTAQVSLRINTSSPATTSSSSRAPKFVSPSATKLTVALQSAPAVLLANVDISPTSSNCTATAAGSVCTATFNAPVGADTFIVSTTDNNGTLLSTAILVATVLANTTNSLSVALGGVIATLQVILGSTSVQAGTPVAVPLTVVALDAAGNVIIGPGNYSTPVMLSDSDTTGITQLSATQVAAPGTNVTLSYNGGAVAGATITASAGSVTAQATFSASGSLFTLFSVPNTSSYLDIAAKGPDGNVWFATGGGQIGNITPAGQSTVYQDQETTDVYGMSAGSDGNIWFGSDDENIGVSTPGGTINYLSTIAQPNGCTGFQPPDAVARRGAQVKGGGTPGPACGAINWMTLGPDGNVWFSDDNGFIGNITPAGNATEWDITELPGWNGTASEPSQITFGPDGNIYVAEEFGLLDRINVNGSAPSGATFVDNPTGCQSGGPYALAFDSTGNIWTSDGCSNLIVMSAGAFPGTMTSYSVNGVTAGEQLGYMISAPGGIWAIDFDDTNIYRLNTVTGSSPPQAVLGTFNPYTNADDSGALAIGGDGNLWSLYSTESLTGVDVAKLAYGAAPIGTQSAVRLVAGTSHVASRNAAAMRKRHRRHRTAR